MMAIPVSIGVIGTLVFCLLLVKLLQRNQSIRSEFDFGGKGADREVWSETWFAEFSSFRYLPMRRVLAPAEEAFWVGNAAGSLAAFRAERRHLFRQYMDVLRADFERLSQGVRVAVTQAPTDRSADIQKLLSMEWAFRKLLVQAEIRLALHWAGVEPLNAELLIDAMQGFEFSLREVHLSGVQRAS